MKRTILAAILAAAALAPSAQAQTHAEQPTKLRICAGGPNGNYTFAATEIARRLGQDAFSQGVEVIHTAGSLDNLRRLSSGQCDAAFSQSDVAAMFQAENPGSLNSLVQFAKTHEEYVHLLCPVASGWTSLEDVGKAARDRRNAALIVGPDGSGSAETWRAIRQLDAKLYERVERLPNEVGRASLATVRDSINTCMLWVSGLNSPDMQAANVMSVNNPQRQPRMQLMDVDDSVISKLKAPNGQPLYRLRKIERVAASGDNPGLYGNLIYDGWGTDTVRVPTVDALLLMRRGYREAISAGGRADRLTQAIEDAGPTIWRRVNPQN